MDAGGNRHARLPQTVETILFDFGGTLDADGVAWKERFHTLYQAEGLGMTAEAFASVFYAADDPLVGGLPRNSGLDETVNALAANLEAELGARGDARLCHAREGGHPASAETTLVMEAHLKRPLDPSFRRDDTHALAGRGARVAKRFRSDASGILARNRTALEALAKRYRLGLVSNFYGNLEAVCDSAGLAPMFGVMADSQCVGVEKPDPALFRFALEALSASPETTLFVGDSLSRDGEGARRSGLSFVWIAPRSAGPEARAVGAGPVAATIEDLPELLSLLK